ncbi:hypothetical protein NCR96_04920 [Helicobacter sp. 14348-15]|uniref:hypothetical protein n=1 Tax=Helicobacter colisuis TaxID=2949739 RepID=UPI00202ACDE6|nr:hypothetical protein [Helicobacter colisuis]MCL9821080.1 hypothetical protein [Helicobacter colisuis]
METQEEMKYEGGIEYNNKRYPIYSPKKLKEIDFDIILIAAGEQYHAQILRDIKKNNISEKK